MQPKYDKFDVVIAGAGPTGLTTALLLRQLGLSVCILDKSPHALKLGRADALNARTQETLEVAGVLSELESLGLRCNTSSAFADGVFLSRQNRWWTSLKNVHRPNFLIIGQPEIERAIISKLDIDVWRNIIVNQVEEVWDDDRGSLVARLHHAEGILEAKYLVGADGARSFVREQLKIPFEGTNPEMVWAVLDTFVDTDFPVCPEIITFQINGQARVSWIPRERGMARFYVLLDGEVTQALTEAKIQEAMKPYRIEFLETEWFSRFEIKERLADTVFSPHRRIILAGDAAHIHGVNGGQGLNTAIADAFALAWRLNLAVLGFPGGLDSYQTERLGNARRVIDVASKLARSTVRTAKEYLDLVEANAGYITGTGVHYPIGSSLAIQGSKSGVFVPGSRCPDVYLHEIRGTETISYRIYEKTHYGKFLFICTELGYQCCDELEPDMEVHRAKLLVDCNFDLETTPAEYLKAPNLFKLTGIRTGTNAESISLPKDEVIVVRPDMYVGYVGSQPEEYYRGFFT